MYHVLVIDDDSPVRTVIRFLLEREGYVVDEAENGRIGLETARGTRPDLILCDLDMPVMDGFETLTRLRADPAFRTVPVIVVSGLITDETERTLMRLGANTVLRKPFSIVTLANIVRSHLPGPELSDDPRADENDPSG
jgi:two-component system, sensor histidine kinase and response regulator